MKIYYVIHYLQTVFTAHTQKEGEREKKTLGLRVFFMKKNKILLKNCKVWSKSKSTKPTYLPTK